MFIDTHCHISKEYYSDIDFILEENIKADVNPIIISSSTPQDLKETLSLLATYSNLYASIGYHPEVADSITDDDLKFLEEHLKNKQVVAIGEIGLDYYYTKQNKDKQKKLFEQQLQLAEKYHLPVVIHSRDATNDTIETLKKYKVIGSIHCFSGSLETAKEYLAMGYYLGIGGVVTFKNSKLKETVKEIPLNRILLETDSPYLSPEPFRGQQNSSKNIPIIATKIAQIKQTSLEEVATKTTTNAIKLFSLGKKQLVR